MQKWLLGVCLMCVVASAQANEDFTMNDIWGNQLKLSQYRGKWVLVNFWATWCPPCLRELPDLISMKTNKKNKIEIIGIAMEDKTPQEIRSFAKQYQINYPIVLGSQKIADQIGRVPGLPTSYLYNPDGKMVAYRVGILNEQAIDNYINKRK